jgi:hypothetical protein
MLRKSLIIVTVTLLTTPLIAYTASDPNQTEPSAPGWGPWRPNTEEQQTDYIPGASSVELSGFSDFKNACAQALKVSVDDVPYWFRLSDLVNQIGTGRVEYGCLVEGNITTSLTITARKKSLTNVSCLIVTSSNTKGLPVYSEPKQSSKQVKLLPNSTKVNPGNFPALVIDDGGQNWVAIASPVKGWIAQGTPGSKGNLSLCTSPK